MAYILRSIVVVGVIALQSPVHGERPANGGAIATARHLAKSATQIDTDGAMQSLSAAREAAQILAGLDPETRQRLLAMALPAMAGRSEATARDGATKLR